MFRLTIKARLYINLGVLAMALLVVCAVGLRAFGHASARMERLYTENLLSIAKVDEIYARSLQSQQMRLKPTCIAIRPSRRATTKSSKRIAPASTS